VRWLFLMACGCGRIGFNAVPAVLLADAEPADTRDAACTWSSWSAPQRIVELSSVDDDWEPALSPDGMQIVYVRSNATSATLETSLLFGTTWSAPIAIASLDTVQYDYGPAWNAAGSRLYFVSDRATTALYTSAVTGSAFAAPAQVMGLAGIVPAGPTLSTDELEMFYTVNPSAGVSHVARATRTTTSDVWADQGTVSELSVSAGIGWPSLSADGLTIYLEDDAGAFGIYSATRPAVGATFSTPTLVTELDTAGRNGDPEISRDGTTMIFSSNRAPSAGYDLFVSTRTCN
jgi:hypothetical protein